ncbi:MAG: SusC/RagA family TonB-linked outer membrane protein [Chitinophagaceae bacterium]|nr:SusC/RagA family TonB-linked outer membrane protein [Chitinophagaceae bacterium]
MRKILCLVQATLLFCLTASAQTRLLSGRITDDAGSPVPFATIKLKGAGSGTSADAQGNFKINVSAGSVLIISAINYSTKEIPAGTGENLSVALSKGEGLIDEVIVTAQGIRRRPRELGYSVAKVSNQDITNGHSPQLAQSLSGKVSGLAIFNVDNSVDPSVKIVLRGYRSLTGNNDALIVIDGLMMPPGSSTVLNLINPNDIESVTVLKGGQAATLYGSDGVNGAIVITTKKGQKGKARVTFNNATNVEKISFLADYQDKFGSGSHYAAGFGTASWKPNYLDRMKDNWRSYENQQFGDAYDGSLRPAGRTLEDGSVYSLPYSAIPDVRKKIWNTGITTNNQLAISGGSDNSTFYMSIENNLAQGIVPEDESRRTGVRLSATTESGRLKAGFNLAYVQAQYNRTTFDFYNETINQAAHIPLSELRDWRNNKFAHPNAYYNDYFTNPFFRLDNDRQKYGDANILGNVELTYKIFDWLSVYNKLGILNNTRSRKNVVNKFTHSVYAKTQAKVPDPYDQGDGSGITRALTDLVGNVYDGNAVENILNNELQLQLNKDFGDFSTKGVLGFSLYDRKLKNVEVSSGAIAEPGINNVSNRTGELGGGEGFAEYRKYGYYADLLTGWKDMIFIHGTFRLDGTSKFYKPGRPKDNYTYPYYGVDLSVNLTELVPGIKNKVLDYAKLRAGFNKNVADNIPIYGLDLIYPSAAGFPYGGTVGITVGDVLPDVSLRPEVVKSYEVGGEFQLLNNRLNLDFTYYTQNSTDQVITVRVPSTTGYSNLRLNVGESKNWGYEADLRAQVIRGRKFTWDLSFRYSYNDNKVIDLYPGVAEFQLSGYSYAGAYVIDESSFPRIKSISYVRDPATNRAIVSKTTGYPLTTGPLKDLGRALPNKIMGWGTKLAYGDITLTANFEYRGGNVLYSDLGRQMTFTGSGGWTENRAPHVFPNSSYDDGSGKFVENTSVNVREAEYALWVDFYRNIAENFTVPAWFIKMRDVNLSYNLPEKLISKAKFLSTVSIGVYGRNLFTIVDSKNDFVDPEFSFTNGNGLGISNTNQTPPVRQLGINLNISFK